MADPLVSQAALEVLEALARVPACLGPLAQQALPVVSGVVRQPQGQVRAWKRGRGHTCEARPCGTWCCWAGGSLHIALLRNGVSIMGGAKWVSLSAVQAFY